MKKNLSLSLKGSKPPAGKPAKAARKAPPSPVPARKRAAPASTPPVGPVATRKRAAPASTPPVGPVAKPPKVKGFKDLPEPIVGKFTVKQVGDHTVTVEYDGDVWPLVDAAMKGVVVLTLNKRISQ